MIGGVSDRLIIGALLPYSLLALWNSEIKIKQALTQTVGACLLKRKVCGFSNGSAIKGFL